MTTLTEMERLEAKATKGPWRSDRLDDSSCAAWCGVASEAGPWVICTDSPAEGIPEASEADELLIAASRNALPALLRIARLARAVLDERTVDEDPAQQKAASALEAALEEVGG